ncbi:MAG TPA: DUF6249 domain-containing protein [Caulobacteraceae bacterium]|jgi:predicted PurR-regulated permease PerM
MDGLAEILVPLGGIAMVVALIVGPIWIITYFRNRERQRLHETLRVMVEQGQTVSADLLETLNSRRKPRSAADDLRRGVLLVAIGLGLAGIGLALGLTGDGDAVGFLCGLAAFLAFIGLGFVVLGIVSRDKPKA